MWNNFLLYPVHSKLYQVYVIVYNWLWDVRDVLFNFSVCCECDKPISEGQEYIKVSLRAYKHTECFDYYSRSHHAH